MFFNLWEDKRLDYGVRMNVVSCFDLLEIFTIAAHIVCHSESTDHSVYVCFAVPTKLQNHSGKAWLKRSSRLRPECFFCLWLCLGAWYSKNLVLPLRHFALRRPDFIWYAMSPMIHKGLDEGESQQCFWIRQFEGKDWPRHISVILWQSPLWVVGAIATGWWYWPAKRNSLAFITGVLLLLILTSGSLLSGDGLFPLSGALSGRNRVKRFITRTLALSFAVIAVQFGWTYVYCKFIKISRACLILYRG